MPHAIIEYSAPLRSIMQTQKVTQAVYDVLVQSGLFAVSDVKVRAYPSDDYLVGEQGNKGDFVHVTIYLLEGRTIEQKKQLTQATGRELRLKLELVSQVSVDIRDMVKETYYKNVFLSL